MGVLQKSHNQGVLGSSPSGTTTHKSLSISDFFYWTEYLPLRVHHLAGSPWFKPKWDHVLKIKQLRLKS